MQFKRVIDSSYPVVYETWTTDEAQWIIQDLQPEHEDAAIKILVENLCTDETLQSVQKLLEDPVSLEHICHVWRECISQRMSLACYEVKNGQKTMVGLNVCMAVGHKEDLEFEVKGEKLKNVHEAVKYIEEKVDPYEYMGLEMLVHALGLVIVREYRGSKLGKRLLAAREPLCKNQGIKGTVTLFTGIASQKLAASCGFETIYEITISQLGEAGLQYPKDDHRVLKYMVKKYL